MENRGSVGAQDEFSTFFFPVTDLPSYDIIQCRHAVLLGTGGRSLMILSFVDITLLHMNGIRCPSIR